MRILETPTTVYIDPKGTFDDLSAADLPPRFNRRWSPVMKAKVLAGIEIGLISCAEAMTRYALSAEELADWRCGFSQQGVKGLTVTAWSQRHKERLQSAASLGLPGGSA